jgi:hypothetical protein
MTLTIRLLTVAFVLATAIGCSNQLAGRAVAADVLVESRPFVPAARSADVPRVVEAVVDVGNVRSELHAAASQTELHATVDDPSVREYTQWVVQGVPRDAGSTDVEDRWRLDHALPQAIAPSAVYVPEPHSLSLCLAAVAMMRRRRRRYAV